MRLIVNTNRIIAALIKNSYSRKIIASDKLELITPEFAKDEIRKYQATILKKASISKAELNRLSSLFFKKIYVVDDSIFSIKSAEAKSIMDSIDPDDAPFIALALLIKNDGIWSDDPHFRKQPEIPIFTTKDIVNLLGL